MIGYDTLRHDILTCAQKLMASQLNLPHGIIILTCHQQQTLSFPQEAKLVPWVANLQSHNSGSQILCMRFQTVYGAITKEYINRAEKN